ncbi:MAG: TerC family protein [Gammaproteobacteria bacterium]|nr:TerC family protein [Gammaproteobacteria bacterium]
MEMLLNPEIWAAFLTLTVLEIVLGIDNIIFISILTGRLPREQQAKGRYVGLSLAMVMRILLLFSLTWVMSLTDELFEIFGQSISARDVILLAGGAFLMAKATREVHNSLEGEHHAKSGTAVVSFLGVLVQIAIIDIVFSLDSVITAVGLVDEIEVMVAAIVTAVGIMMLASTMISEFVENHPTVKMLALTFLILIGLTLMGEGLDFHTPKGYIYFAMAFAFGVELLNLRVKRVRADHVHLRKAQLGDLIP